jgi:ATP-dependent Clp protease protease subunit
MYKRTSNLSKRRKTEKHDGQENAAFDPLEHLKSFMTPQQPEAEKDKNHIYFYADVDQYTCLDLNRKIVEMNKSLLKYSIDYDTPPPNIYLHINSMGGCLFSAFSTIDTIKNSKVPIISIVEGCAASAATVISMVCHKRYVTSNSFMLIHQLSTGANGTYENMKDGFLNDTKLMELLYNLYQSNTSMNMKTIKNVLKRDIWWDANECLKNGLVDSIWTGDSTNLNIKNEFKNDIYETNNVMTIKRGFGNVDIVDNSDNLDSDDEIEIKHKSKRKRK